MRVHHRGALAFACLLVTLVQAPGTSAVKIDCRVSGQVTQRQDGWTEVRAPEFPHGDRQGVTAFAAAPTNERVLLVSNGITVMRSRDAGCTWAESLNLSRAVPGAPVGVSYPHRELVDLSVGWADDGTGLTWLLAGEHPVEADEVSAAVRPVVLVSGDGGGTWQDRSVGLPAYGEPVALRVSPLLPGVAYVAVRDVPTKGSSLFVTHDGGATWRRQSAPLETLQAPLRLDSFAVSPNDALEVWGWGPGGVWASADGGQKFRPINQLPLDVSTVLLTGNDAGETTVRVFYPDGRVHTSDDGGVTWRTGAAAGDVWSAATVPSVVGIYATASDQGVRIVRAGHPAPYDVTPRGRLPVQQLAFTASDDPWLYGVTPASLLRRPLAALRPSRHDVVDALRAARPAVLPSPVLLPARTTVTLAPGESRDVGYELRLPPSPKPLDVYFLADTTTSMAPVVRTLRRDFADIVNDLAAAGIPAWFGVADFREYPLPYGVGSSTATQPEQNYAYRRLRPVGPVNSDLRKALNSLTTGGGARDSSDSALEALYQSATGAGRYVGNGSGGGGQVGQLVPAGLGAGFRDGAVKVIVLATDTAWREAEPGYPGPSSRETFDALVDAGVKVVGLSFGNVDREPSDGAVGGPGDNLRDVATVTRTFAPPGGVDCDGDRQPDLLEGEPLVCVLPDLNFAAELAPAMANMLRAIEDPAPVHLVTDGPAATVRVLRPVLPTVNVKVPQRLPFVVRFTCPSRTGTSETAVRLAGQVRGVTRATATALVRCVPAAPPPRPAGGVPPLVQKEPAAALPGVPPPVVPPPAQQPGHQVNPNVQLNPNAGLAAVTDQEQQHQTAADEVRYDDVAPADPGEDPAPALLLGAALVLGAATAAARRAAGAPAAAARGSRGQPRRGTRPRRG